MEGRMKFTYQFDENSRLVEVTLSPEASLSEVLESFEGFLFAAGYRFDGNLDFYAEEESTDVSAENTAS